MSTTPPTSGDEAQQTPGGDTASEAPASSDLEALARLLEVDDASGETLARRLIAVGEQMLSQDSSGGAAATDQPTADRRDEERPQTAEPELGQVSDPSNNQESPDPHSMARFLVTGNHIEESGHTANHQGQRAVPKHFVPTPQYELTDYACPESGRRFTQTAHPGNDSATVPIPYSKCEKCVAYRKYKKAQQYFRGRRSAIATTLVAVFPNPIDAGDFASRKAHDRRIPGILRFSILKQSEPFGPDQPCEARIIWDGVANADQLGEAVQHAKDNGGVNITTDILPVFEEQFLNWLPNHFSIGTTEQRKDGKPKSVYTCRFSNGWPQPVGMPSDWRGGRSVGIRIPHGRPRRTQPRQDERGRRISSSWRPKFLQDPDDPEAIRALHRARYVNIMDWITHWETTEFDNIQATQYYIEQYRAGQQLSIRNWQNKTHGPTPLVIETARWLRGQRQPEPAIVMVSERLGFTQPGPVPAIDSQYLAELTSQLPEFMIFDPV